jgi:hypothetical protein
MTKDLTLSILHMTGDILSDPNRRCVGTLATDESGTPVNPTDAKACHWCLTGALGKAMHEFKVKVPKDQVDTYNAMKDAIGLGLEIAAPIFWDSNEGLHGLVASRLQKAE